MGVQKPTKAAQRNRTISRRPALEKRDTSNLAARRATNSDEARTRDPSLGYGPLDLGKKKGVGVGGRAGVSKIRILDRHPPGSNARKTAPSMANRPKAKPRTKNARKFQTIRNSR